jgi:amino acid adenylation domain-containing protein
LQTLLAGIVANPDQRLSRLPLLTADERHRLLVEWNDTTADYPRDSSLHALFEAQVTRAPDAVALVWQGEHVTYRQLNRQANQLAHHLRALGVAPEVAVGICLEHSPEMVVGLLGILKAGGAYVPLDPTYPKERLAFMLQDAQVPILVTQQRLLGRLPGSGTRVICLDADAEAIGHARVRNPNTGVQADNPAYVIYTSGSTGTPRGVLGRHRGAVNGISWLWRTYPFEAGEVCCQKTSLSFVDSVWEIFAPLLQGIRLVVLPDEALKDPHRLVQNLAAHHVTRIVLVPSLLQALLDTEPDLRHRLPDLSMWSTSGEALPAELIHRFQERMPQRTLVNLYGMSEASANSTWHDVSPEPLPSRVPIGRPIANTQVYVLDRHLQPVPIGVPGELHIGGIGLARGYRNRPELTAEHFIPHPFSQEPGARLLKTGDVARHRPDGGLEYLGRLDHQVKIRGFRIEPGEIEAALNLHPAVRETAVIAREDVPGERRLVAYVVPMREQVPTAAELRGFLHRTLPDYMLPTAFVWLDVLPLTPNGKTDRQALPSPDHTRPELQEPFVAPRTPIERQVAGIWAQLLGLKQVGIHDNFFELGGHSLLATQLIFRMREALHVEVSLVKFFETPTVAALVSGIAGAVEAEQGQQPPAIVRVSREPALPASITQEHIWGIDQLLPGLPLFNISYALQLTGELNVAVLEQSINELIKRHEILRTTFGTTEGRLVQVIAPPMNLPLMAIDLRDLSPGECDAAVQQLGEEEARQPFNLAHGPLLRALMLRLGEQDHLLLITLHHIICDGWSLGVLAHELAVLYDAFAAGAASPLPELPIQYADFAHWQRQWRHNAVMRAQLAYWEAQLRDPLPALKLPTDHPRGGALGVRTARHTMVFPKALFEALKRLSQREGSTLFMTLVAAFKMLLYGYTGEEDLRVATLMANRNRRETAALIGLLVNTVILRTNLSGDPTGREVLQRVRATTLAAYAHQDLPFEDLVRTLERERGIKRTSLSQVMVIFQNAMVRPLQHETQTLSFLEVDPSLLGVPVVATTFDVILTLRDTADELTASCVYKKDLFDDTTVTRLLADFQRVLERLTVQPEQPLSTCCAWGSERGPRM